jgi:FlaA1/EpsC-like NDP-sugar epimerase
VTQETGRTRLTGWRESGPYLVSRLRRGAIDIASWLVAGTLAFLFRYDFALPAGSGPMVTTTLALFVALKLGSALALRLHRQSWLKLSFRDARAVTWSMMVATAAAMVVLAVFEPLVGVPPAVPLIDGGLATLLMLTARGITRYYDDRRRVSFLPGRTQRNVLVIGAGDSGSMLVREMQRHPEAGLRPVAFLDDDRAKRGLMIGRVPVVGGMKDLAEVLEQGNVDEVLIAIPSAEGGVIRSIVERVHTLRPELVCRTIPSLSDLLSGTVSVSRVREVGIEDLLRRPAVQLDNESILNRIQDRVVMVTGAGGSIGSELVRQLCRYGPRKLILFGHGENSIYQLEREIDRRWPAVPYDSVIGAVQNVARLDHLFRVLRPDIVFHAAAHKHVPLMERNPEEAVFNNIVGSRNLVHMVLKHNVSSFVNISTDKAVNPSSVMGASKRVVELLVENASRIAQPGKTFVSVRFGNVLGSRGSAIPIFQQQIREGGPVTVTHPDMVRYFMTIPEAARLVLQAFALGRNGEIYILDMGEPVRVLDLVKDLIRLSGLEPDVDIAIVFTGIRPGEKLVEELMTDQERVGETSHDKVFVARPNLVDPDTLDASIKDLVDAAMRSDGERIRALLAQHGMRLGAGSARQVKDEASDEAGESPQALRTLAN